MELNYKDATLTAEIVQYILDKAEVYKILPSLLITQLHVESLWGKSPVAVQNNNLSGMSMSSNEEHLASVVRPSGVRVTKGSKRPDKEGGYYYRYQSVKDFIDDWTYLLRPDGIYKVSRHSEFQSAVKGLFKVGGAKYDYAASGYDHYLKAMLDRRHVINAANSGALDRLDDGGVSRGISFDTLIKVATQYIGVTQASSNHKKLIDRYNQIKPLPVGYTVKYSDDWCDAFITVISDEAGTTRLIGRECGVERHKNIFKQKGIWHQLNASTNTYQPQAGDIVIFRWDNQRTGWAHHIGIVESISGNTIHTIEGNVVIKGISQVARKSYPQYAESIQGYARPRYGHSPLKKGLTLKEVAGEVVQGKWGNGDSRIQRLMQAGYDPQKVQEEVNRQIQPMFIEKLVDEIIAGKHGNGQERIQSIRSLGHEPELIQAEVNKKLNNDKETIILSPDQPVGGDQPRTGKGEVQVDGVNYLVTFNEK